MPIIRNAIRIGRSRTGFGAFAKRDLPANRRIAEYRGPLLSKEEAEREEERGNRYLFEIDRDHTIDGSPRWNIARYLNHSCYGNCETAYAGKRVFIKTVQPIQKGEELVYDYGLSYVKNVIGVSNCQCGRCRRRRTRRKRKARLVKIAKERREKRKRAARLAKPSRKKKR